MDRHRTFGMICSCVHLISAEQYCRMRLSKKNGRDCGVFTCLFLEAFITQWPTFDFGQEHIPFARRRILWNIMNEKILTSKLLTSALDC